MDENAKPAERMPDVPEDMRAVLSGIRPPEVLKLKFVLEEFDIEDLKTVRDSLETLRSVRRFGRFGMWMFGFIAAGASAAAATKIFLSWGAPK